MNNNGSQNREETRTLAKLFLNKIQITASRAFLEQWRAADLQLT